LQAQITVGHRALQVPLELFRASEFFFRKYSFESPRLPEPGQHQEKISSTLTGAAVPNFGLQFSCRFALAQSGG